MSSSYSTQNDLLLKKLMKFYAENDNLDRIIPIINGDSKLSIRIIDWFVTNYSKKYFTIYDIREDDMVKRFKVYTDYKLKLRAYSKKRFDPFCRWERINIPYKNNTYIQTTIGQLNFFKWALENNILEYIQKNQSEIEKDMNSRNSTAKKKNMVESVNDMKNNTKTRKVRQELSISASKSIKKENVQIVVKFN